MIIIFIYLLTEIFVRFKRTKLRIMWNIFNEKKKKKKRRNKEVKTENKRGAS